ncbi:ATP-binding cassette domain-containing protein [Dasania sp. GY-MA-18]|uniref:ATP-binding cassette domain-containing protein n=1 Tax=Dasania phycosphaerae TaxID=2950436 RepID=A0A9J6RP06_9GAMM|nr:MULTISPECIES: ATP-binding cassette domain-containing protein [Dasania]MCR8923487.1 ATP-binding cassette domain-containing protein [Dasania sp. GY-MA-18]MCZ0865920.1 ATP-binding cassette domain-containing protein [Dasania phycosphaerae]MCZ0869645.1 ATP-binding cassette domain-containing protein [Dasania phycosphaerae]
MDIKVSGLKVKYPRTSGYALEIDSLEIQQGTFLAVIGESGSGKTTFLKALSGQIKCYTGSIDIKIKDEMNNRDLSASKHSSLIYQGDALCDTFNVLENVLIGRLNHQSLIRKIFMRYSNHDIDVALEAIRKVGMEKYVFRKASELSGGQRQRVSIARAIVQEKPILLADEPIASLDPINADRIIQLLSDLAHCENMTVIVNLHQMNLVNKYFNNILGLKNGKIQCCSKYGDFNQAGMVEKFYG